MSHLWPCLCLLNQGTDSIKDSGTLQTPNNYSMEITRAYRVPFSFNQWRCHSCHSCLLFASMMRWKNKCSSNFTMFSVEYRMVNIQPSGNQLLMCQFLVRTQSTSSDPIICAVLNIISGSIQPIVIQGWLPVFGQDPIYWIETLPVSGFGLC